MRFGTGLFALGFSPIQKTVVTIFFFHGYRSPVAETLCLVLKHPALIVASAPIDRIDIAFIIRFLVFLLSVLDVVADAFALRFFSERHSTAQ